MIDDFSDNKDPASIVPVEINWARWLPTGQTVASASWSVESGPDALLLIGSSSTTTTTTTAVLSGGTVGGSYVVRCAMTTSGGLVDVRRIQIGVVTL